MKTFILLNLIFLLSCNMYNKKTIRSIKEYSFRDEKTGSIFKTGRLNTTSYFNKEGKLLEKYIYDTSLNIILIVKYGYDSIGNCISIKEYSKAYDLISEKYAAKNQNGKIISFWLINSTYFCEQKNISKHCEYNKEGYVTTAIKYDPIYKEMIIIKKEFKYEYW